MSNKNCSFVSGTGYNPFKRCEYCERRVGDCFGFQFLAISIMIIGLVISVVMISDLPALVTDILIVIIILIALLSHLASKESNEITLNNALLEHMNRELEDSVKQRTEAFERANHQLIKIDKMKDELIGIINHELKTPITCVLSSVEVIKARGTEKFDESQKKLTDIIFKSGQDMLKLTNDLLDLSKIESDNIELHPENFPIINLIEEIVQGLKPIADKKNVKLATFVPDNVSTVYGDPDRLKQVLFNLIDNAIKYSNDGGTIEISVKSDNNKIMFEVTDHGVGIKPDHINDIFNKFSKHSAGYKGTGLGLYIAKSFIEAHKGNLSVSSEYGKGAKFTFFIPKP
jgi:signal transduction histidine kinase